MNQIIPGDCLEIMPTLNAESVDAIVTDPPYGLKFMGKNWDHSVPGEPFWREALRVAKPGCHLLAFGGTRTFHRLACSIEDAGWEIRDTLMWVYGSGFPKSLNVSRAIERQEISEIERQFCEWLREESGLSGSDIGTDRFHEQRIEIVNTATKENPRYGRRSLVPTHQAWQRIKSKLKNEPPSWVEELVKNPPLPPIEHPGQWKKGKCEGTAGNTRWQGFGTALKPAFEPIILARKPLVGTVAQNVQAYGTGALNIDSCRISAPTSQGVSGNTAAGSIFCKDQEPTVSRRSHNSNKGRGALSEAERAGDNLHPANACERDSENPLPLNSMVGCRPSARCDDGPPRLDAADAPTFSPPQDDVAEPRAYQTTPQDSHVNLSMPYTPPSAVDYTARHIESQGRWPANFLHDGSEEVVEMFQMVRGATSRTDTKSSNEYFSSGGNSGTVYDDGDNTSAARFFYTAKASQGERNSHAQNRHPTVKPVELMRYLCRLVTPPDGVILDPFMGSGSTGVAAKREGFDFIGIELDAHWCEVSKRRIGYAAHQKNLFNEAEVL